MIGLFIGSFNPITKAHLEICNLVPLDKVILVPVNNTKKDLISINKRLDMIKLIVNDKIGFDDICLNYNKFDYRVLTKLKEKYHDIKIIMGSDLLVNLKKFDYYEDLLNKYSFIIIERNGYNTLKVINDNYLTYKSKFEIIPYNSEISSSLVRKNINKKIDNKEYLDIKVLNYIEKNHLYEEE